MIFNRKNETQEYMEKIETILCEQKETQQTILKEIQNIKTELNQLKTNIGKEINTNEKELKQKITDETGTILEQLQHMNDITLTEKDIQEFTEIGYQYINKKHGKEKPQTIIEALQNIEETTLPEISEPNIKEPEVEQSKKHLIKIADSLQQPYLLKLLPNGHFRNKHNTSKETKFTINDVMDLKEKIPHYHLHSYTKKMINERYPHLTISILNRLIWNIEEGNFDELIEEYQRDYTNVKYEGLNFNIQDKYKKRYNISKLEGLTLYRKGQGNPRLGFNILDVLYIRESIPRWKCEQTPKTTAAREAGMSKERLMRVIYNLEEGVFDKYLTEFEDINGEHKFTLINNTLYIDTKDTGLSINTVQSILQDYTNAEDKYKCLKNLLRTNTNTESQYIILITRYYDDSDFRNLILHSDKDTVTIVNNPEKRRDYGTSLIGV